MLFESKNETVDSLNDFSGLTDLTFPVDVTIKFNTLNPELQDSDDCMAKIISEINALKSRLLLGKSHLDKKSLTNF
jgi:hypothetical protein